MVSYGNTLKFGKLSLDVSANFGMRQRQIDLRFNNGVQTVCDNTGAPLSCNMRLGAFEGLNSTYNSRWRGQFAGLGLVVNLSPAWRVETQIEQHRGNYQAQMDWNLRQDLQHPVSQSQLSTYKGTSQYVAIVWQPHAQHGFRLYQQLENFYQDNRGIHRFHTNTGAAILGLNDVNWQSSTTGLSWTYGI